MDPLCRACTLRYVSPAKDLLMPASSFFAARLRWLQPLILGTALLAPSAAWAGDVKFGAEPLATDDNGNITGEGKSAATDTLKSLPGEEVWTLNLWAKIDKGGPGPLYVEFLGKLPDGKEYVTYRHEHSTYNGEKYVSLTFDLEGNLGFNKGKTYKVKVLQGNTKPNRPDIILATGSLTLEYVEPAPEEDGDGGDEPDDTSAQDELDTLSGPDDESGDSSTPAEGPPPVDPADSKKGCTIGSDDFGLPAVAVLFALGLVRRRND